MNSAAAVKEGQTSVNTSRETGRSSNNSRPPRLLLHGRFNSLNNPPPSPSTASEVSVEEKKESHRLAAKGGKGGFGARGNNVYSVTNAKTDHIADLFQLGSGNLSGLLKAARDADRVNTAQKRRRNKNTHIRRQIEQ